MPTFGLLVIIILSVLYLKYIWDRRNLYRASYSRQGPPTLPIVGNALMFLGNTEKILEVLVHICKSYESPTRIWLGSRLFFIITEPEHIEIILNSPRALEKEDFYKFSQCITGLGIFAAPVGMWKRNRKIIMPTFNQKILDGYVEIFSENAQVLNKQLKKLDGGEEFDIFRYISLFTLDTVCETAMGIAVNAQTTDAQFVKWANRTMEINFYRVFAFWYHSNFIFNFSSMAKDLKNYGQKLRSFTENVVKQKREAFQKLSHDEREKPEFASRSTSFLQKLIEISEKGEKWTDVALRDEVMTLLIAGSDTTATISSFTLMMLGMFPLIQDQVYEEIVTVAGYDRPIECSDLYRLRYLEMVLKETMRIFPVAAIVARAITGDIPLGDGALPKGASAVVGIIYLHRNPKIWPEPMKFDPLRFSPEECSKRHPYSYIPFSGGPRNCVGLKYAMMAMKTVVSTVIREYKVSCSYKSTEEIKLKLDMVSKPVDGYKISLKARR